MLGGQNASASFTDAWVFSTDSGKWAELTGVPADITGAAYAQAETSALVWMFGGTNSCPPLAPSFLLSSLLPPSR